MAGALLGLVLFYFKQEQLASFAWILGIGLSFARYALGKRMQEELIPVQELATMVDFEHTITLSRFQEMIRIYLEIMEPEFASVKDSVVNEAIESLTRLAQQKTSGELSTGDYYNWLLPILAAAPSGSHIWAVSRMLDAEWDDSPAEQSFLRLSMEAIDRGVYTERVFIVRHVDIPYLQNNPAISAQLERAGKFMTPLLAELEYLESHDPNLLKQVGDGLCAFDTRVALIDASAPEGSIRGYVTMNPGQIMQLRRTYEALRVNARDMKEVLAHLKKSEG